MPNQFFLDAPTIQFFVEKSILVLASIFSCAGLWKVIQSLVERNKNKADTERTVAGTWKQIVDQVMVQLNDVRNENMNQSKQMARMESDAQKSIMDERADCDKKMQKLKDKIHELEILITKQNPTPSGS